MHYTVFGKKQEQIILLVRHGKKKVIVAYSEMHVREFDEI